MFVHLLWISVLCIVVSLPSGGGKKLYYIEREILTNHNKATEECKRMGMNLATITTEKEFEFLKKFIHNEYGSRGLFWLDGYKKDGEWIWKSSGKKIEKFFWHPGQPNNIGGSESCLNTGRNDFNWHDNDCEKKCLFICDNVQN